MLVLLAMAWAGVAVASEEPAPAPGGWRTSQLVVGGLRHSDIALMPEGTPDDLALFAPLHPTVVAWGEDALPVLDGGTQAQDAWKRKDEAYRELGVRLLATNVWMLTATEHYLYGHPEYLTACCVDLWGARILPRWLADADYRGVKPWWGCTNNPRFVEHLRARMRAGLAAGATMVHLDDHAGTAACAAHAGGCFCEYCLRGFRAWLPRHVSREELAAAAIGDPAEFDYRAFLRRRGYADRAAFITAAAQGSVPLWPWFLAYQRTAAREVIARMRAEAETIAGRPVAFGVNAYNLLPNQLFDAGEADYFANEVEHFDHEDLVPPLVYRLAEALGRPAFATGTGEDWIAYRRAKATVRVRGWVAEAYAFGGYFMYSWKKWGFSEATGTQWTEVDPEVFRPMCAFVSGHRDLFDGFENAAAVGLLYDNASANRSHWQVRDASRALLDAGVPYGIVAAGDELLDRPLTAEALNRYRTIVVPADVIRTEATSRMLAGWEARGGRIVAWKPNGSPSPDLPGRIGVQTAGRVWVLPRVRTGAAGQEPTMVLQVLNRDYLAASDAYIEKTRVRITVDVANLGGPASVRSAWYFRPEAPAQELRVTASPDGTVTLEVPDLQVWGVIELR